VAKPFSIQSPEDIAKEYAGNKQRIAQAMQLGVVDSTAGVLAGMFIDRMRSAQMQEQAPRVTVAQQVMGGAPATPPPPPSGGLGAAPPVAPPMAPMQPPMQAPMPAPGGPPMGMAMGGLATLPVPDAMFDEPTNGGFDDGYAGGGLVAFADGGPAFRSPADYGDYIERTARSMFPNLAVAGRGRTAERNAQVGGVADSYHLIDAARDLTTPPGMSKAEFIAQLRQTFGPEYDIIPSKGNSVHVEPGPALGKRVRGGTAGAPSQRQGSAPAAGLQPPSETLASAVPAAFKAGEEYYAANMPERKNEGLGLLTAEARRVLDPEAQKKRADQDKWMMLAEIGFNMASSNSPYLLQAASAAAAAALPGARAAKKEREAEKREAIRDLAAAEDITYKQAAEKTKFITDFAAMQLGLKKDDLARSTNIWQTQMQEKGATERTAMQVAGQKDVANITAGSYARSAEAQVNLAKRQAMGRANQAALDETAKRFAFPPKGTSDEVAKWEKARDDFYQQRYNFYLKSEIGGGADAGQGRTVSQGKIINAVPIPQ
jgi:hypothetical protein